MNKEHNLKNIIFPIEFKHLTGGMLFSTLSLVQYLSKEYDVYILAHKDAEILNTLHDASKIKLKNEWNISIRSPIKTLRTYFEVKNVLSKFDKNNTLIITNNVGSEIIMNGFGFFPLKLKRIFVSRGGDYTGKTGFVLKKGFKSLNHCVAISNRQFQILQNSGISTSKISIIHNGIYIKRSENFKYTFHKNKKIQLSIIGYISSNKNQLLAVNALSKLIMDNYDVELNIYGLAVIESDKSYERKIRKAITELNIIDHVKFRGFEKNKENIYLNTDILISCSLSEGFGRSIVEGMAFGIPCIGLKESGGLNDIIVNNVNGILIQNEVQQLVDSIKKVSDEVNFRNMLSTQAKLTYKLKFTEAIMCDNYKILLKKLF